MKRCSVKVLDNVSGRAFQVDCYGVSADEMAAVYEDGPSHQLRRRLAGRGLVNVTSSPFWVEELPDRYPDKKFLPGHQNSS